MKKQILTAIFLCLVFLVSLLFLVEKDESKTYKILKVLEADSFYIDINDNNKIDDNELFKIKNIIAFSPVKNLKTEYFAHKLGIKHSDYLKIGYLARTLAKEQLTNKEVSFVLPQDNEKYVDIKYKNKNLAEFLLKNGLAFVYENTDNPQYIQFQNIKQIKANAKELSNLDFALVNTKTKIAHKLDSEHFFQIRNGEIYLKNQLPYLNFVLCKSCFDAEVKLKNKNDIWAHLKSKNVYPKSISKKSTNIELFLINPLEHKKPNSVCNTEISKRIIKEINESKTSIDIALYGINDQKMIIDALRTAKQRGVRIRAVVDYSLNMGKYYHDSEIFIEEFGAKTDSNKTFMHNKFIIFDNKKVLTGSVNISSTGSGGYNSNSAVIVDSSELAQIYTTEFEQMFDGKFSFKKEKIPHSFVKFDETIVSAYFSPKDDVYKNGILPVIQNAKRKIYVSAFYLTDRNLINELISAKKRNVEVVVILDALGATNFKDRIIMLRSAKIPTKVENWGGKNHEKTIMADDEYLILGSSNFTISGFYKNDENVLIIKNPQLASFYGDYFLYLFNSIDNKYLKFIPRTESLESKNSCFDGIDNNFDGKIDSDDDGCKVIK